MLNKTKIYLILLAISFSLWNCGSGGSGNNSNSFTLQGELTGWENDSIVVQELKENTLQNIKTITLDDKGSFEFSDTASNPRFLFLRTQENNYISLLVLGGQNVKFSANKENFNDSYMVSGSEESSLVWALNSEMRKASLELDSLSKIYQSRREVEAGPELDSWLQGKYQELRNKQRSFIIDFINQNYESAASLLALSHQLANEPVLNAQLDFEYFEKVDAALSVKYPESSLASTLHTYVEGVKYQRELAANAPKSTAIGAEAPEISLKNPEGEVLNLTDYRGKYVLLDFWAAWCGPCRRENPNLVKAYANYKDKGFEIFQVSLDRTHDDWVGAIKADKLDWIHVSDLKYWSSVAAKTYGVQSIPASFLVDPEGKIVAKNLRGPALEQKLNEVLN